MKFKMSVLFVLFIASLQKSVCQEGLTNKEIARFYFEEVVNKQRLDLLNKVFADTFHVHILGDSTNNRNTIATQRSFLQYLFKAFPDIQYRVGDIIEERDKVAIRVTLSASYKNEFWGISQQETE